MRHRPQAATLALRRCVCRSFPGGKSWRTLRTARHKPNVSVFAGILPRRYLAGFLCQGAILGSYNAHKNEISIMKFPLFFSGQNSLYTKGHSAANFHPCSMCNKKSIWQTYFLPDTFYDNSLD